MLGFTVFRSDFNTTRKSPEALSKGQSRRGIQQTVLEREWLKETGDTEQCIVVASAVRYSKGL